MALGFQVGKGAGLEMSAHHQGQCQNTNLRQQSTQVLAMDEAEKTSS